MDEEQEEILSQKLSQLSTTSDNEQTLSVTNKRRRSNRTSSPTSVISKKIKMADDNDVDDNDTEQDQIPTYLLETDKSFHNTIQKIMNIASSTSTNDLRQIAILIHHIAALHIQKQISMIYLQSGTGILKEPEPELIEIDRRVWPIQVKSVMLAQYMSTTTATVTTKMTKEDEQLACENLVHQRLREMTTKIEQYQRQLNEKKSQIIGFTSSMEDAIKIYVHQHGIKPLQMKRNLKIALLQHDYDAEIIERKYSQENPNKYQV